MNGILILLLLILIAALPAIIVYFWFRAKNSPVTLPWFLASLAAGIVSLLVAVLAQKFFSPLGRDGLGPLLFGIFIRIALVEEASRLVCLIALFSVSKRWGLDTNKPFGAAIGLVSGLGFAMIENTFYGLQDINIILLRGITAAPLHSACGIRAGTAIFTANEHPLNSLFLFISAILIHGAYNLMIVSPALPSMLAIPIAFAALFASIHLIKPKDKDNEKTSIPAP